MAESSDFRLYRCGVCGFSYSERAGLEEDGFPPGTRWEDIPDTWTCPDCDSAKSVFEANESKK